MCTGYRSPHPCATQADRRSFLKAAGAALVVAASAGLGGTAAAAGRSGAAATTTAAAAGDPDQPRRIAVETISYQLYTARSQMSADAAATLNALGGLGLRRVEHAGYAGLTPQQFRAAADAAGVHTTSGHTNVPFPYDDGRWQTVLDQAEAVGQLAVVEPLPLFALPGLFLRQTPFSPVPGATWLLYADALNRAAAAAAKRGIRVGYHNHDIEFRPLVDAPGKTAYDVLLAETDPALVHFEMDLYWVVYAGKDPATILAAAPERFRRFHVKDMATDGSITAPGTGVIDFASIFSAAADAGVPIEEYIIEQDNAGEDALRSARLGYRLLRTIRW